MACKQAVCISLQENTYVYEEALSAWSSMTMTFDAILQTCLRKLHCTCLQEELRFLASMSHAQRRLYEADVKHLILQQYCREPLALYECLLAPPLTAHEHHLVREMLLPASRVS